MTISHDSRLVVLGGEGDRVEDFYGGAAKEYAPNPSRFVATTHVKYLNRLSAGLAGSERKQQERALVNELASLMWLDMSCEEAALLEPAALGLIRPWAFEESPCDCELCSANHERLQALRRADGKRGGPPGGGGGRQGTS